MNQYFRLSSIICSLVLTSGSACYHGSSPEIKKRTDQPPTLSTAFLTPPSLDDGIEIKNQTLDSKVFQLLTQMDKEIQSGTFKDVHSLLIYHGGSLIYENYFRGSDDFIEFENDVKRNRSRPLRNWGQNDKHYVASINKGLTSLLVGIALEETRTPLSKTIAECLPEYSAQFNTPEKRKITLENALTMRWGFAWDEWGATDLALLWHSKDFVSFLLARNNLGPGDAWVYNSAGPYVLLHCMQNLVNQPLAEWADQRLYQKLGISDYLWEKQPDGWPEASARMFMRPRDVMKVGLMLLNQGDWKGQSVVPKAWVDDLFTTKVKSPAGDYSYLTWLRNAEGVRYLSFEGDGGQFLNVYPAQGLVVVMNQGHYLDYPLWKDQMDAIQKRFILPAFAGTASP